MAAHASVVELYTLSTCPWCRRTRTFLEERGVGYTFIDYDTADEEIQEDIEQEMLARGAGAFPYARVHGDFVVGYDPEAFTRLLRLS